VCSDVMAISLLSLGAGDGVPAWADPSPPRWVRYWSREALAVTSAPTDPAACAASD